MCNCDDNAGLDFIDCLKRTWIKFVALSGYKRCIQRRPRFSSPDQFFPLWLFCVEEKSIFLYLKVLASNSKFLSYYKQNL